MGTVQHNEAAGRGGYPPNWDDLRRQVLERAEYRCEGSPRYPDCRAENGRPHPVTGTMVVLAAAHVYDDDEDTTDIARLRCLCQRCHTAYDADLHMRRAAENRATRQANGAEGGRRISVYEASLKAATLEVKVLAISGKQVTLSVFRQLKQEDIVDVDTTELRGRPWGTVNYFWKGCAGWLEEGDREQVGAADEHLHVVWQRGEELRRACVYADGTRVCNARPFKLRVLTERLGTLLMWHRVLAGTERDTTGRGWAPPVLHLRVGNHSVRCDMVKEARAVYQAGGWQDHDRLALERVIAGHHLTRHYPTDVSIMERLVPALEELDVECARWKAMVDGLSALDQLFIAV